MAHEKLRFNILLKDNESNCLKSARDPIYSAMNYGTHYSIYANVIGKKRKNNKGVLCFHVDSIEFYIQNFSGSVTIGITKFIGFENENLDNDFNIEGFSSGRHLKGLMILQGLNCNFSHTYPSSTQITKKLVLYHGDLLEFKVLFLPIENLISRVRDTSSTSRDENTLYVDTEYMVRDGENIVFHPNKIEAYKKIREIDGLLNGTILIKDLDKKILGPDRPCKMKMSDIYIT